MSTPQPFDLLARHGAFLRRLAGALTASAADADDLVQDTWVTALERPPRHADRPRGWLGSVARHLNGKQRRTRTRRAAREVAAARPEAIEVRADAALVLQEVVRAVVALDEPLRQAVTERYFEDLSVRAIADRHGLSEPTVKGRLRRARAQLREVLDDFSDGDRDAWCSALVGLGLARPHAPLAAQTQPAASAPPATAAGATSLTYATGALFLMFNAKVVSGVSLALLVALGFTWRDAGTEPAPLAPVEVAPRVVHENLDLSGGEAEDEARRAVSAAPLAEESPAQPQLPVATLEVLVTDLDGVPASGVEVLAGPPAHPLDSIGSTEEDGTLTVRWSARPGADTIVVGLRARGEWLGGLRRLRVGPGATRRLVAAVDPVLLPAGWMFSHYRLSLVSSSPVRGFVLNDFSAGEEETEAEARRLRTGALEPSTARSESEPLTFISGVARPTGYLPVGGYSLSRGKLASIGYVTMDTNETEDTEHARVRGEVRDLVGEPARGVRVAVRHPGGRWLKTVRSAADGTFEFDVPVGDLELIAGPALERGAFAAVELAAGAEHRFDARIDRGLVLRGQARTQGGEPFANGRVEATHPLHDGLWIGIAVTGEEGRFELPNCPAPVVAVDFAHPEACHGLPLVRHAAVAAGGEPWSATIDTEARAETQLLPLDEEQRGPLAGELRVWDATGRRGARISLGGGAGTAVEASLPEGAWEVSIGANGPHWSEAIPVLISRGDPIDLGSIGFEPGGWLELPSPAEGEAMRIVRTDGPHPSVVSEIPAPFEGQAMVLALPEGTYRIERTGEGRELATTDVRVRAGQTTVVATVAATPVAAK